MRNASPVNELALPSKPNLLLHIIRIGLTGGQYGYATAVGLIQGIVSLVLVMSANQVSAKLTEVSIW